MSKKVGYAWMINNIRELDPQGNSSVANAMANSRIAEKLIKTLHKSFFFHWKHKDYAQKKNKKNKKTIKV